jgi:hypothetical protein
MDPFNFIKLPKLLFLNEILLAQVYNTLIKASIVSHLAIVRELES